MPTTVRSQSGEGIELERVIERGRSKSGWRGDFTMEFGRRTVKIASSEEISHTRERNPVERGQKEGEGPPRKNQRKRSKRKRRSLSFAPTGFRVRYILDGLSKLIVRTGNKGSHIEIRSGPRDPSIYVDGKIVKVYP